MVRVDVFKVCEEIRGVKFFLDNGYEVSLNTFENHLMVFNSEGGTLLSVDGVTYEDVLETVETYRKEQ